MSIRELDLILLAKYIQSMCRTYIRHQLRHNLKDFSLSCLRREQWFQEMNEVSNSLLRCLRVTWNITMILSTFD
jgi:hypothetical protein